FVRQAADDARGDRILIAGGEHDRSELEEPSARNLSQVHRARNLERVRQSEVGRDRGLQTRSGPAAVGTARGGGERRETDVAAATPVAADRPQGEKPDLASVGTEAQAVDAGAADNGDPPAAVGAGAKQGERVVVDHELAAPRQSLDLRAEARTLL